MRSGRTWHGRLLSIDDDHHFTFQDFLGKKQKINIAEVDELLTHLDK